MGELDPTWSLRLKIHQIIGILVPNQLKHGPIYFSDTGSPRFCLKMGSRILSWNPPLISAKLQDDASAISAASSYYVELHVSSF